MNPIMNRLLRVVQILGRILGAMSLLAVALFCVFGFLASFEPGNGLPWKIGYGALGCGCLAGSVALFLRPLLPKIKTAGTIIASAGLFFLAVLLLWLAASFHLL